MCVSHKLFAKQNSCLGGEEGSGNLLSNVQNRLKYLAEKQLNFLRSDKLQIQNPIQIEIGKEERGRESKKEMGTKLSRLKAAAAVAKHS